MSAFNLALAGLHLGLFETFGQPALVVRGAAEQVAVTVVEDKESQLAGEYGSAVSIVTVLSFLNAEWTPKPEDVVTLGGAPRRIVAIGADDGFVTTAVLHG